MHEQLIEAKRILEAENCTCVALRDQNVYKSHERGIKPILQPLNEEGTFFCGSFVADRIIGKSAALLLIKGEIAGLYTRVLSEPAKKVLDQAEIPCFYDQLIPYVINRDKTGMCPMENSVLNTDNPEEAFVILNRKVQEMMG